MDCIALLSFNRGDGRHSPGNLARIKHSREKSRLRRASPAIDSGYIAAKTRLMAAVISSSVPLTFG